MTFRPIPPVLALACALIGGPGAQAAPQDWVSVAVDQAGHWSWQFDSNPEAAISGAINRCAARCKTAFTVRARCIAYAESRVTGYWFGAGHGEGHGDARFMALERCKGSAPAQTCRVIKEQCEGEH